MATNIPENLLYTKEHEWAQESGEIVIIGVTDFAQSSLGDIVFIELPEVGQVLKKDDPFGVVESIKSVSDLYSPVEGEVIEINEGLCDTPELVNEKPYESWMIKIKLTNKNSLEDLLSAGDYKGLCE